MENKKIENVIKLDAENRYDYFIRKVADFEELWGLKNDEGWALAGDEENNRYFPIWPEKEFAKICSVKEWVNYKPELIQLKHFIDKWIPGLKKDDMGISVFQTPTNKGLIITADKLKDDLLSEAAQYE